MRLFGSSVSGLCEEFSDVDLCVLVPMPVSEELKDASAIVERLAPLFEERKLDC